MKMFFFFVCVFLALSCDRSIPNESPINNSYLDKEIAERSVLLNHDTAFSFELDKINKSVLNLTLLTIDIENINASIISSNKYFTNASHYYGVDTLGFECLYKGLPLSEFVGIIKKNHLNLLNKIIIKQNKNGELMFTAQ